MTANVPCRACGKYNRLFLPVAEPVECGRCGRELDRVDVGRLNEAAADPGTVEALAALDRVMEETRRRAGPPTDGPSD